MSDLTKTNSGTHNYCPRENCPHVQKLICPHYGEEGACYTELTEEEGYAEPERKRKRR